MATRSLRGAFRCSRTTAYGIYVVPELSTVGLTEAQARETGVGYEVSVA